MIQEIELSKLKIHPRNVRKTYNDIDELAESIRAKGILQNLTVVPDPDEEGMYLVVIGNRRLTAARKAGLKTAPCFVDDLSEKEQATLMLTENMQRDDLTIYEQACGFQLVLDLGETEEGLQEKTGFSKTTIRRRLNIAKLDGDVLQEKENDGDFQLSLSDLYELEKVSDIEKRNEILRSARDSRDIAWKAKEAVADAKREKSSKKLISMFKKKGIEQAPDDATMGIYTGKWETVKTYNLEEDVPKKLDFLDEIEDKKQKLFYMKCTRDMKVIRKKKKEKRERTPEEIKKAERDSRKKRVKAMQEDMTAARREFILSYIDGKVKPLKNNDEVLRLFWEVMRKGRAYINDESYAGFFIGKSYYEGTEEEKKSALERVSSLNVLELAMVAAHNVVKDKDLMKYNSEYYEESAEIIELFYEALRPFGFSYRSDEEEKLVKGVHELYTPVEIDE